MKEKLLSLCKLFDKKYFFNDRLFLFIFFVYHFTLILDISIIPYQFKKTVLLIKLVRYCIYLFFVIKIYLGIKDNSIKKLFIKIKQMTLSQKLLLMNIVLFLLSVFFYTLLTRQTSLILFILSFIAAYDIKFKKMVKLLADSMFYSMIFLTSLCSLGVIQNYVNIRIDGVLRNSIGYFYVLQPSQILMLIFVYRGYLKKFKFSINELLVFQLLNVLMVYVTDSRTAFYFMELLIVVTVFVMINYQFKIIKENKQKKFLSIISFLEVISLPLYILGSYLSVIIYGKTTWLVGLNKALSNRLDQTWNNFNRFGLHLFGTKIQTFTNSADNSVVNGVSYQNFIDNQYMQILFNRGIIIFVLMMLLIFITLILLKKKQYYWELYIIFILLTFSLLNPIFVQTTYSVLGFLIVRISREYFCANKKFIDGGKTI